MTDKRPKVHAEGERAGKARCGASANGVLDTRPGGRHGITCERCLRLIHTTNKGQK